MKPPRLPLPTGLLRLSLALSLAVSLAAALGGCASSTAQMAQVRALAAESAKLGAWHDLTARYRDTYAREQPYLSPEADARERAQDAARRAASADFLRIGRSVQLYMQTLGTLAGDNQYDLEDQVKSAGTAIKAWPDSGLDERHVNAYAGLTRLLAHALGSRYQERAVRELVQAGDAPLQALLDAMRILLRAYAGSNDNEQALVTGLLEVNIPYRNTPDQRLLATLAKVQLRALRSEYRLIGRRLALTARNLDAIAAGHKTLLAQLQQADDTAVASLAQASAAVRASQHQAADDASLSPAP
ncbi:hypothetical protein H3H36_13540 [Duganella sp. FT3S]|uniref:DUF3829 domain-containing protein n=1 Tax=Rugamonas fusca TaxID=2758568 RepID=A0A7W2EI49_9BURK|nr:hypothetical protein [Rugamonas fusca]MBA5606375.1 hypothetical protein [Rugamonas fusca]